MCVCRLFVVFVDASYIGCCSHDAFSIDPEKPAVKNSRAGRQEEKQKQSMFERFMYVRTYVTH